DVVDSHRTRSARSAGTEWVERTGQRLPADAVSAMRQRAVRIGVSGVRDLSQPRRPERAGLRAMHRDQVLLEQLSVQGAAVQLGAVWMDRSARRAAES